ncbi:MAG: hypothetical protein ACTSUE_01120, partial [Promethearchaeota archaeon]
ASIEGINHLKSVETLTVAGKHLARIDPGELEGLDNLRELNLAMSGISDPGMLAEACAVLPRLERVVLYGTPLARDGSGVARLRARFPGIAFPTGAERIKYGGRYEYVD